MRYYAILFLSSILFSCGNETLNDQAADTPFYDTLLRLPMIADGIAVDTNQSSLHLTRIESDDALDGVIIYTFDSVPGSKVINVYADSAIEISRVDSMINKSWRGEDVRLIGLNNGQELAIPFHGLHRFPPETESHISHSREYFNLKILSSHCEVNNWTYHYTDPIQFFAPFYSDAFSPYDSSSKYPSRMRHSVDGLMMEGSAWDGMNFRDRPDSAQLLATYNEFVNKLEIFDKAGTFWTMRVAMIDVTYDASVSWGRFMQIAGDHYHHLTTKRSAAKRYLSDYIANKGTDPKEFTAEDLHLLYPDRLRWNGFISGELESRYDAYLLTDWE